MSVHGCEKVKQLEDIQKEKEENLLQTEGTEKEFEEYFIAVEEYRDRFWEVIMKIENLKEETKLPEAIIPKRGTLNCLN